MGLWSKVKKVAKKVVSGVKTVLNVLGEIARRLIGLPSFVWDMIIPWPRKRLRVRVLILTNEDGTSLDATRDLEQEASDAYSLAKTILKNSANVKMTTYGTLPRVEILDDHPPRKALEPRCGWGGFKDIFGEAGWFYTKNKQYGISTLFLGNGAPITVFIVRDVLGGKQGCSNGAVADYVTVDLDGLQVASGDDVGPATAPSTTMTHELAHACGLNYMLFREHSKKKTNLMYPDNTRGTKLNKLQRATLRNSRFVTYL